MKVDLFAFGGGFASLPILFHDILWVVLGGVALSAVLL